MMHAVLSGRLKYVPEKGFFVIELDDGGVLFNERGIQPGQVLLMKQGRDWREVRLFYQAGAGWRVPSMGQGDVIEQLDGERVGIERRYAYDAQ